VVRPVDRVGRGDDRGARLPRHVVEIARLEGVDVDAVDVPFADLAERPVGEAASVVRDHAENE